MKPLFSPEGLRSLRILTHSRALYAFDFDGTLCRIVRDPMKAAPQDTTLALLRKLQHQAPIAILSGRRVTDLRGRLGFTPAHLIGNHGLEGGPRESRILGTARNTSATWKRQLEAAGLHVEDKEFSLSLHYRRSRNRRRARLRVMRATRGLSPRPRIVPGKCVLNLVPPGAPHKGTALATLLKTTGFDSALYVGDDVTDEDVFSTAGRHVLTVRVGESTRSQARYFIRRQAEIDRLLQALLSLSAP